ncbi:MAG: bacillithiol biosynthesis BshC [Fibrobacterota bacterium]
MNAPSHTFDFYPAPPLVADYLSGGDSRCFFHFTPDETGLARRLEHLGKNEVVITCGHQACLLGGPLYVAYKILTAVNLCRFVRDRFGVTATPLFWLADDDDDTVEVATARSPFGHTLHIKAENRHVTGLLPSPAGTLEDLPAISAENWGGYHKKLLRQLFGKYGVTVMSPLEKETQKLRAPFFNVFEPVTKTLWNNVLKRTEELREAGFKPQVPIREGDRFLYMLQGNQRARLNGNASLKEGTPLTSALSRLASLEYALPVLADVSGPAETAYHAETAPFYESLGRRMPVIWPRFSATLVRENDERILAQAGSTPGEIILDRQKAELRAALQSLPDKAQKALERFEGGLNTLYDDLRETLSPLDRGLPGAVEAGRRKALLTRSYIEKKLSAAARRQLFAGNSPLALAYDFLYPGTLQERYYNFVFFTYENPGFLDRLLETVDPFSFKHTRIRI